MAAVNKRLLLLIAIRIMVKQRQQQQQRRNQVTCRGRRKHKFWVRPIYKQRNVLGSHKILFEATRIRQGELFLVVIVTSYLKEKKNL